jgi:nanoRNase/pAp phosphatase (c-di-AMP/oligoRNAs hydrolase)
MSKFEGFLSFLKHRGGTILITTHDLVDIDGFASCFNLKYCINQLIKEQEVSIYFSELSKHAKDLMEKLTRKFPEMDLLYEKQIDFSKISVVIVLDTNNLNLTTIKHALPFNIPVVFIDHHFMSEAIGSESEPLSISIISDEYSSTAEIILDICRKFKVTLPTPYKFLLTAAILTDSGFFNYGNNNTIKNVGDLLGNDILFQDIVDVLKFNEDFSEKLAIIKGLQRVELIREKDWLIGLTSVSSFEASVASSLIKNGFDIGIVISKKKSNFRISTRAKKGLCLQTGLHLGKILEGLSDNESLSGGGHNSAASLNGDSGLESVLDKLIEKVKQTLINQSKL